MADLHQDWSKSTPSETLRENIYTLSGAVISMAGLAAAHWQGALITTALTSYLTFKHIRNTGEAQSAPAHPENFNKDQFALMADMTDDISERLSLEPPPSLIIKYGHQPYADTLHNAVVLMTPEVEERPSATNFTIAHEAAHLKFDKNSLPIIVANTTLTNAKIFLGFGAIAASWQILGSMAGIGDGLITTTAEITKDTLIYGTSIMAGYAAIGLGNKVREFRADRVGYHASGDDIESARSFLTSFKYEGLSGLWRRFTMPSAEQRLAAIEEEHLQNHTASVDRTERLHPLAIPS